MGRTHFDLKAATKIYIFFTQKHDTSLKRNIPILIVDITVSHGTFENRYITWDVSNKLFFSVILYNFTVFKFFNIIKNCVTFEMSL